MKQKSAFALHKALFWVIPFLICCLLGGCMDKTDRFTHQDLAKSGVGLSAEDFTARYDVQLTLDETKGYPEYFASRPLLLRGEQAKAGLQFDDDGKLVMVQCTVKSGDAESCYELMLGLYRELTEEYGETGYKYEGSTEPASLDDYGSFSAFQDALAETDPYSRSTLWDLGNLEKNRIVTLRVAASEQQKQYQVQLTIQQVKDRLADS